MTDYTVRRWVTILAVPALAAGWAVGWVTRPDVLPDRTIGATLSAPRDTATLAAPPPVTTPRHTRGPVEAPTVHHTTPPLVTTTPPAAPTPQPTPTTAAPSPTTTATTTATATDSPPPLTGLGGATTTPRSTP